MTLVPSRKMWRLIASAIASGGVAFGGAVSAAFANGAATLTEATYWVILAAIVGAMAKDVQASLSQPPGTGADTEGRNNG